MFFTGHLACGKPQRLKVDDSCLSGMWHCHWVRGCWHFGQLYCLYLQGCRLSDFPDVRNYSSICTSRAGVMRRPPSVPIYKGHWDVMGIIRNMVLANSGFPCAKEFLRKLSDIRVCTVKVFTKPTLLAKKFKRMSVRKGTKLMPGMHMCLGLALPTVSRPSRCESLAASAVRTSGLTDS